MLALEGTSLGLQIGVHSDTILLFMVEDSVEYLTGNEVLLFGKDYSVAAGPKGSDLGANTNLKFDADILRYNRSRGVFVRIELPSSGPPRLRHDREANRVLYGREVSAEEILLHGISVPDLAAGFMAAIRSD